MEVADSTGIAHYWMVQVNDPDGVTRAYAFGPIEDKESVRSLALDHLATYRREKARLNDPLASAEYTVHEFALDERGEDIAEAP